MLNDLKKEITDCYMYGEIICQQGFGPKTDISMHDMIRFDLLQFLVYLTDSSDGSLYPETRFLHEYLGQYFTLESLMRFKQDRTVTILQGNGVESHDGTQTVDGLSGRRKDFQSQEICTTCMLNSVRHTFPATTGQPTQKSPR